MNIRSAIFILISIILFGRTEASIPYNQYWSKANNFYKQKKYDSAIVYYEKIATAKPSNAVLYYNLGNAHYRSNNIAQSILNYKRALKLNSGYADAKDNLELAQARMSAKPISSKDIFFIAWWKQLTHPATSQTWAVISLVTFLSIVGFLFWIRWKKVNQFGYRTVVAVGTVFFFIALIAAFSSASKQQSQDEAVVMVSDAAFKADIKSAKSEMLPEGTIVECKQQQGEWIAIQLSDGREGWLPANSIERI